MAAIAAIDERHPGILRRQFWRSLLRMTHDHNVRIGIQDPDGVCNGLTLRNRRGARIAKAKNVPTHPEHGRLKT